MNSDLPPLIAALLQPQRYAHEVRRVELMQTHISWVLLAGEFAYKIKKPVRLHFLDFSTLSLRRKYCLDELRLNRRFAPDIYLDVISIFNTPLDPQLSGQGEPIEYAVKMRRFDQAGRLDHVCARAELSCAHLSELAQALVSFHTAAARAPASSRYGAPPAILAQAMDNFADLKTRLPQAAMLARLAALQTWTLAQFEQLGNLMERRRQTGHVRECHGDLHLGNLVLTGQRVRMFDCIEFNDDLRWIDVACEIAFTYVDLLAHDRPALAVWFVNEVLSRSGDYESAPLLRFYAVYRALVRAKVDAIRLTQTLAAPELEANVLAHTALAELLVAAPAPRLVITHGPSGCGKTVASAQLLQTDPHALTLRLRSDVERKRLFGLSVDATSESATNAGIYTRQAHDRTYAHLRQLADLLLRAGWSVIVDASFLTRADRASFRALAQGVGVDFAILAPQATAAQLRERIHARAMRGSDASEATLDVLEDQLHTLEPLGVDEVATLQAMPPGQQVPLPRATASASLMPSTPADKIPPA